MRELEKVANQLYKITGNSKYDYCELYYENIASHHPFQKKNEIEYFFEDSVNFLQATRYQENFDRDKLFILKFDNLEQCVKALLICQSHGLYCVDDGELTPSSTFDYDGEFYEISVAHVEHSAYDFIHGKDSYSFSISNLSKILTTRIPFSYYYGEEMSGNYSGVVENGEVHFEPTFSFNEWVSIEEFYKYTRQLFELVDYVPSFEIFKKTKPRITLE